jgi:hypothetical protein
VALFLWTVFWTVPNWNIKQGAIFLSFPGYLAALISYGIVATKEFAIMAVVVNTLVYAVIIEIGLWLYSKFFAD